MSNINKLCERDSVGCQGQDTFIGVKYYIYKLYIDICIDDSGKTIFGLAYNLFG